MSTYADRLKALREQLKAEKLDGFVVPLTDEHMSEYVGSYAQRLAWLTGFQGSAGSAVVLPNGRRSCRRPLHAPGPPAGLPDRMELVGAPSTTQWLEEHAPEGARITARLHERLGEAGEGALAPRGWCPVDRNPIDEIWKDRPSSKAPLVVRSDQYAGKSAARSGRRSVTGLPRSVPTRPFSRRSIDRLGIQHPQRRRHPCSRRARLWVVHAGGTDLTVASEKLVRSPPASRQRSPSP